MSPANTDKDAAPAEVSPSKEELLPSTDITGQKRKVPEKQQNRFKIVGRMVMAMQRFQASINPTYTYGKRHTTSGTNSGRAASDGNEQPDVNSKPVTASPPHAAVYPDRGHKADYLFRPLPDPTPSTEHRSQQRKTE